MAGPEEKANAPRAALYRKRSGPAAELSRRAQARAFGGIALAGLLAALAALSLAASVDQWPLGLMLGGTALLASALVIGYQLRHAGIVPSSVDKALLIAALESENIGRVITDRDGRLVSANQAYRRLCFGRVPAPRNIGRTDTETEEALQSIMGSLAASDRGKGIVHVTARGKRRALELSARNFGAYVLWEARAADPEVLLKKAVAEIHLRLRSLLDGLGFGFLVRGEDGQIGYMSDTARNLLGVEDLVKGLQWSDLADSDGQVQQLSGSEARELKTLDFPIPGIEENQVIGQLTLLREYAWRQAGPGAEGSAPPLSVIFEDAPMGVAIVADDCCILQYNRTFQKIYRKAGGGDLKAGVLIESWLPEDESSDFRAAIKNTIGGKSPERPLEVRFGADREYIVQMFFSTAKMEEGDFAILYVIDTTEQKGLEVQFAQGQKMQAVGQLAGGIAHDFNNLLTAIIGFCDLLLVRHGPGDQSFADLMQIKQNANRAANLVRQLLAFSRRQTLRPKVLVVTDVLAEITSLIRRLIGEKIALEVVHGRGLGPVKVDQGQLEQVIINLAVNARDAMESNESSGGKLTITTRHVARPEVKALGYKMMPPDDYVQVSVSDTGHGISETALDKLFEPFFTTKEVGKGTGLGLSTVYGIVKQTGGFVFARNRDDKDLSSGAIFDLFLPVHRAEVGDKVEAPAGESAVPAQVRDLTGKETIVIAEDEDAVRMFAARALSNKGYKVLEFASGEAALEGLRSHDGNIDLLISDVVMPGLDGPTLVEEALKDRPDLKTILISGYAEGSFTQDIDQSANAFLPKPFSLRELAERVKEVLEG